MKRNNETLVVAAVLAGALMFTVPLAVAESFRSDRLSKPSLSEPLDQVDQQVRIGSIAPLTAGGYQVTVVNAAGQAIARADLGTNETVLIKDGPAITARAQAKAGETVAGKTSDRLPGADGTIVAEKNVPGAAPVITIETYQPRAGAKRTRDDGVLQLARFGEAVHQSTRRAFDAAFGWI